MQGFYSYVKRKFKKDSVEDIHNLAQEYFGNDFANPSRIGCPPPELFHKLIAGKKLPDKELQNHLLGCSECFNDYQAKLRQNQSAEILKKNSSALYFKFALAGSLAIVLIAFGSLLLFWRKDSDALITARNDNSELARNSAANAGTLTNTAETNSKPLVENPPSRPEKSAEKPRQNEPVNKKQIPVEAPTPLLLAKSEVEIDLNSSVWRDPANVSNQKNFTVEAQETQLRVRLPKENPAGIYHVFFTDAFGKIVTEKKSATAKNQILSVKFDLRKLKGDQNRLCVAPADEVPDCISVNIISPK